jgi:Sjoegren syndrome nuclear autoantigen 1
MQTYNAELVRMLEDLRAKKGALDRQIQEEEEEKLKIGNDLKILTERLQRINESLARRNQTRSDYETTIRETESAYLRILESSQTLLQVLKKQQGALDSA